MQSRSDRLLRMELYAAMVVIVVSLCAILAPLITRLQDPARDEKNRLQKVREAVLAYRKSVTAHAEFGTATQMGLPTVSNGSFLRGTPDYIWRSAFPPHPFEAGGITLYTAEDEQFAAESKRWGDRLILAYDLNCNASDVPLYSEYFPKRGLGILMDGTIVDKVQTGNPASALWWSEARH